MKNIDQRKDVNQDLDQGQETPLHLMFKVNTITEVLHQIPVTTRKQTSRHAFEPPMKPDTIAITVGDPNARSRTTGHTKTDPR